MFMMHRIECFMLHSPHGFPKTVFAFSGRGHEPNQPGAVEDLMLSSFRHGLDSLLSVWTLLYIRPQNYPWICLWTLGPLYLDLDLNWIIRSSTLLCF